MSNQYLNRRGFILGFLLILFPIFGFADFDFQIHGNDFFSKGKVKDHLAPFPQFEKDENDSEAIQNWKDDAAYNLSEFYRKDGFFEIQIQLEIKNKDQKLNQYEVKIEIIEGPHYRFGEVIICGDSLCHSPLGPNISSKELNAESGMPYQSEALLKDRQFILRKFGDAGFIKAELNDRIEIKPMTKSVDIKYFVTPYYPIIFDTLILHNKRAKTSESEADSTGNNSGLTSEALLRSLVPYKRGDTVRISETDRIIGNLQYTGAFNYIRFKDKLLSDSTQRSALFLETEEHIPGNVHGSLFYETQYGPGISIDIKHSNVYGTLTEWRTGSFFALSRQNLYLGYGSPLNFGYRIRFDNDADLKWYQDPIINSTQGPFGGDFRAANSTRLTFPVAYWLRLVSGAELEALSGKANAGKRERDLNLNFIQTAFFSFLNQPMDPTRGLRFAFTYGNGGPLFGANQLDITEDRRNWIEMQSAQYYFFPSFPQLKFATRFDAGRFFQKGESNSDRFFLGGSRSVRSFNFNSLCLEKDLSGNCTAKELALAYYLASGELRMEPFNFSFIQANRFSKYLINLQIVPFMDYAQVWNTLQPFELDDPGNIQYSGKGYSYGIGFRYPVLGIFKLRVDFATGNGPKPFWIDLAQAF